VTMDARTRDTRWDFCSSCRVEEVTLTSALHDLCTLELDDEEGT